MRGARLAQLTPSLGGHVPKSLESTHSSFHPRHVHTPRTPGEEPYPSPRRPGGVAAWWLTFQQVPCQMTAYVAPATAAIRVLWILLLYLVILRMCPIPEVSQSVKGVEAFVGDVQFSRGGPAPARAVAAPAPRAGANASARAEAEAQATGAAPGAAANASASQNATLGASGPNATANRSASLVRQRRLRGRDELVLLQDTVFSAEDDDGEGEAEGGGGGGGSFGDVASLDDVALFTEALVGALFTEGSYNGRPADPLMLLKVHRLLSSIVVSQKRVKASDCAYEMMKPFYPVCYGSLDEASEDVRGWQGVPYDGQLGAVALHLPLDKAASVTQVRELLANHWWDRATRESAISFVFHNAPGHFTGYCQVGFTLSPYGDVKPDVDVAFLRLQPYADEVDGWKLALFQGLTAACLGLVVLEVAYLARNQVHIRWSVAYLLRPWAIFDCILLVWVFACIGTWVEYMRNPARTQFSDVTGAPAFSELASMAEQFSGITFVLSTTLLLSVLRFVEYLTLMPEIGEMYRVLAKAVSDMLYFFILLSLLFIGFTLAGHLLFGSTVKMFSHIDSTMHTLVLWFFALGGDHEDLFERPGGVLFLVVFMFALMIVLFNMLIGIVTNAFDAVAEEEVEHVLTKPWNHTAADWLCDVLRVEPFEDDPYNDPGKYGFHDEKRSDSGEQSPAPELDAAPRFPAARAQ